MGPLRLGPIHHPLPSHRANFGPICAKASLPTGRRRCQGWVGKAKGKAGGRERRAEEKETRTRCFVCMDAAIEKGWVGVGVTSHEALWAGGVTSNG